MLNDYRFLTSYVILYFQSEVTSTLRKVAMSLETVAMEAVQFLKEEAAAKGVEFPSSHFVSLVDEANEEIKAIYRDIVSEMRILDTELIADILESPTVSFVSRVYLGVWSQIARLQHHFSTRAVEMIQQWQEQLTDVSEIFIEGKSLSFCYQN